MACNKKIYNELSLKFVKNNVQLVAVSKLKPIEDILEMYDLGQRDFGENYVQELLDKVHKIDKDIRWHFIGHLQTNKVKQIVKFVYLIQSVDSLKLLKEIDKQCLINNICVKCLIQIFIASEETKYGLSEAELDEIMTLYKQGIFKNVEIIGVMGMASFSSDLQKVRDEFKQLKSIANKYAELKVISMGMSQDFEIAIDEGSNMVRIGSMLFGKR